MKSCLVVDDSRVVRKVARRIAEGLGYDCVEVENGQSAYDYCLEIKPDFIILDWNMPIMSGIEFLEKLRQMKDGGIPFVLFCTAESDLTQIERAMMAGANEYVMKPFDNAIMRSKLTHLH